MRLKHFFFVGEMMFSNNEIGKLLKKGIGCTNFFLMKM